jgi:hypothetical protein
MGLTSDRDDPDLQKVRPDGMQEKYLVLSPDEIDKGFVEPLRESYYHERCGTTTTMVYEIAATCARNPEFYGATWCSRCGDHYPVGVHGQFVWMERGKITDQKVGTRRAR